MRWLAGNGSRGSVLVLVLALTLVWSGVAGASTRTPVPHPIGFDDVTVTHLVGQPAEPKHSMAVSAGDLDGDGDLDLAVAAEYGPNRVLINDGTGRFTDESAARLARTVGDHEDVAIADYDEDGDLDLVFVGEDDQVYGYHLNDGQGTFTDVTDRIPVRATSNAVVAVDVDEDGDPDLVIGNAGPDVVLINDGAGRFADESARRLPESDDVTQDIGVGDVDGAGDPDLVFGNEDGNRLLLNDATGIFTDAPDGSLPPSSAPEETRDAVLADADGDGDLDLHFANVQLFAPEVDPQDRLLLNDGSGRFSDVTAESLPVEQRQTMSASYVDVDHDGDLDLLTGTMGDISGQTADEPWRVALNDGSGHFVETDAGTILPAGTTGNGFDAQPGNFDGDGLTDLFLASRGGTDRLLLGSGGGDGSDDATPGVSLVDIAVSLRRGSAVITAG